MVAEFSVGRCRTKAAYSVKLRKQQKLDLAAIKKKFKVILETPILLVVRTEAGEVIVHGYGELIFKKCEDTGLIEKVAERIYEMGLS